jgi:hypothetical protein
MNRRLIREEHGGMLVEVLVSAAILLMVAAGVVAAFTTTQAQSADQRTQAVAANVAASEIERLRSLRFADLPGLNLTQTKNVGGVDYTIQSTSAQAMDPVPAGSGCDNASRSPEALRVTTTVTWPRMRRRPIVMTSMVAAPADSNSQRGSIVVQIVDRDGYGVNGLNVTVTGGSNAAGTTDDNGCVRFTDLLPGQGANAYRLRFGRSGWKTTPGNITDVDDPVDVVAGQTQVKSYQYDPIAPITATFFYTTNGAAGGTRVDLPVTGVSWVGSNLSSGRQAQTVSPAADTVLANPALPVSGSSYGVHAGTCAAVQPPAGNLTTVPQPSNVADVRVPTVRVDLTVDGSRHNGAEVYAYNACSDTRTLLGTTSGSGGSAGRVLGGVAYSPGNLALCAEDSGISYTVTGRTVTNYGAVTVIAMAADTSGGNRNVQVGNCA